MANQHNYPLQRRMLNTTSALLMGAGVLGVVVLLFSDHLAPEREWETAMAAVSIGVILWCYGSIRWHGRSIDEAYRLGFDLGYEIGWRQAETDLSRAAEEYEPVGPPPWPTTRQPNTPQIRPPGKRTNGEPR